MHKAKPKQLKIMSLSLIATAIGGGIAAWFSPIGEGRNSLIAISLLFLLAASLCLGTIWQRKMFLD